MFGDLRVEFLISSFLKKYVYLESEPNILLFVLN